MVQIRQFSNRGLNFNSIRFCLVLTLGCLFSFINPALAQLNVTASSTGTGCAGNTGTATAYVSGGSGWYEYNWNNGATGQSISGLAAGTYTVNVKDTDTGYSGSATVTVNQYTADLHVNVTGTLVGCPGNDGTASAHASGGSGWYVYTWSNGATTQTISGLAAGTYSVTVMDKDTGCSGTGSVTLEQYVSDLAVSATSQAAICGTNGAASASASGGSGWYVFNWSNGATGNYVQGLAPGTYSVTVMDKDTGCFASTTVTVGDSDNLSASATSTLESCWGGDGTATAVVTGGTGQYTYQWSNGGTTNTIFNLTAGTYTVTVTSGTCTTTASVTVEQYFDETLMVAVSGTESLCGEGGSATATASGGSGWFEFTWSNGTVTGAGGTDDLTSTVTGLAPGTYSVTLLDTDTGCSVVGSVTVNDREPVAGTISTTDNTDICIQDENPDPITINLDGADGTNSIFVITDDAGNILALSNDATVDLNDAGAAGVCLLWHLVWEGDLGGAEIGNNAADLTGCYDLSNSIEVTRTVTPAVTIDPDNITICAGEPLNLTATAEAGGADGLTYLWTAEAGSFDDPNNATTNWTMMMPGTYTITVEVYNDQCLGAASIDVVVVKPVAGTISTEDDTYLCVGNGVADEVCATVTGQSGTNQAWVITDADLNILEIIADEELCFDFEGVNPGVCIIWHLVWELDLVGAEVGANAADLDGCFELSNPIEVTRVQAPTVSIFQSDFLICDFGGVALYPLGDSGLTYEWSADGGNLSNTTGDATTFQSNEVGVFTITLKATRISDGCMNTATVTVEYQDFMPELDVTEIGDECGSTGGICVVDAALYDCDILWSTGETTECIDGLDAGTYSVTISDGAYGCTVEYEVTLTSKFREIGDYVWYDNNENCTQDTWETGVPFVKVNLMDPGADGLACTGDDVKVMEDRTDENGHYLFECVPVGTYFISYNVSLYPDYQFTCVDGLDCSIGGDSSVNNDYLDNDATATAAGNIGKTDIFTISDSDGNNYSFDAGIHKMCNDVNWGGSIGADQEICAGQIPSELTSTSDAGPHFDKGREIEYLWMFTMDASAPIANWTMIPDSNSPNYQPGPLYMTHHYIRCARRAGCEEYLVETNAVTVEVIQCNQTIANGSINEVSQDNFTVYPNPVFDQLNIQNNIAFDSDVVVEVINTTGTVIRTMQVEKRSINNERIDMGDAPAGAYFVRIKYADRDAELIKVIKLQ